MSHRRLGVALLVACAALPLTVPATAPAASSSRDRDITVMARNLYLGADLIPLATQPDRATFEAAAAERFRTVLRNDYPTRAKAIAHEIRNHKPDLVGLQEAARWLRGVDGLKDGQVTPATQVVYDSTDILLRELRALGQRYRVVGGRDWFDYEAPTALGFDVRLIQRDVILVREKSRVRIRRTFRGGFRDTFDPPTVVGQARQLRGWVGVDARLGKRNFRFVTTHLEAYDPAIGQKQMRQLLNGPLKSKKRRSILVGDFNSDPKTAGEDSRGADRAPSAYNTVIDAGFANPLPRRETCCFPENLRESSPLESWIDHIVMRPRMRVLRSSIVGSRPVNRIGGLWPSDHAGIVAKLRLR